MGSEDYDDMFDSMDEYDFDGFDDFDDDGPVADLPIMIRNTLAESSIEPERNIKKRIRNLLSASELGGDFCCGGKLDTVDYLLPAIEILQDTTGQYKPLPLPIVYEEQARDLIKNCSKSPFGRGEATIYDDNVRKSWQLDPHKFRITNPKWDNLMENLVNDKVKIELGIEKEKKIDFSLYKMLLYEEGGFFDFHRDTEKEDGMIATLVVQLPSSFTGGEIVVRHNEREKKFDCDKDATFSPYYVSFYCDCSHKVEKVTSGYRLALIYILKYTGSGKIEVFDGGNQLKDLQKVIDTWIKKPMYSKLCFILEHKYSTAGLNPSLLKGNDETAYKLLSQLEHTVVSLATLEKAEKSYGHSLSDICETKLKYSALLKEGTHSKVWVAEDEIFPDDARRAMPLASQDQFKDLCEDHRHDESYLKYLLKDYKSKHTDKRKHLLMAYTSSLLVCSEDSNSETTYNLDVTTITESCLALDYLPLSLKFVERLWFADGLMEANISIQVAKIIKHHGVDHFKALFEKYFGKCFLSNNYYSNIEGVGRLIIDLKEQSWLDMLITKLTSPSQISQMNPESVMCICKLKEEFPSLDKIDKIIEGYVLSEIEKSNTGSYSNITSEVIIKLNRVELCTKIFKDAFGNRVQINMLEPAFTLVKHFGIEKTAKFLTQSLDNLNPNFIGFAIDSMMILATKSGAEEIFVTTKLLEAIGKKLANVDVPSILKLLTFCKKNNKIAEELNIAKSLIANQNFSKPNGMYNLIQGIIKENGTECFYTGSGFRLLLEHCYKLLYDATTSTGDSLDLDLGNSSWAFKHIKISCKCDYCVKLEKFIESNEKVHSWKEKQGVRKHLEKSLTGVLDIERETIKQGSPQTLKLTKIMKTPAAKQTIASSVEAVLKQFIQYATTSDQKPRARPVEASSSQIQTVEPPTKKVKQEQSNHTV